MIALAVLFCSTPVRLCGLFMMVGGLPVHILGHGISFVFARRNVKMATDAFARPNPIACTPWRQLAVQKCSLWQRR
jgi:hypothetical protein